MYKEVLPQSVRERADETWDIGSMGANYISGIPRRDHADQHHFSPSISELKRISERLSIIAYLGCGSLVSRIQLRLDRDHRHECDGGPVRGSSSALLLDRRSPGDDFYGDRSSASLHEDRSA